MMENIITFVQFNTNIKRGVLTDSFHKIVKLEWEISTGHAQLNSFRLTLIKG